MRLTLSLGGLAAAQLAAGLIGQLVVLRIVGIGRESDAYIAAQAVPMLVSAVMTSSFQSVWLPRFARLGASRERTQLTAEHAVALGQGLKLLAPVAIVLWVSSFLWVRWLFPGFTPAQQALVVELSAPLFLAGLFSSQSGLLSAALRADGQFVRGEVTTLVGGAAAIVGLIILVPRFGISAAPWVAFARAVAIYLVHHLQLGRPSVCWRSNASSREVWAQAKPLIGGGLLIKTGPVVDRFWSSKAPGGGMTLLNLAQLGVNAIIAILERAILVPAAPQFSRDIQSGEFIRLSQDYRRCLLRIAVGTGAVSLGTAAMWPWWTEVMLMVLRIGPEDARTMFFACLLLTPSVFGAVGATTATTVLYAFGETAVATRIGVGGFLFSLLLKGVMFSLFGVLGLAASISLYVVLLQGLYHAVTLRRIRQAMAKVGRDK